MKKYIAIATVLTSCAATQPGASSSFREIGHTVAVGYCAVHRAAEPLILLAEAAWPPMTIPARIADAFCAAVAANDLAIRREALVSPAGTPPVAPLYSLAPIGFSAR